MWHKKKRAELVSNPDAWNTVSYYIVECSDKFENCGGTADRLGPIPLHLRMAATYHRFLLISWRDNRPARLEEFLLPPRGGIDWRMPEWLLQHFHKQTDRRRIATYIDKIKRFGPDKTVPWLRVKLQSHDAGQNAFDMLRVDAHDPSFLQVYHDVWRIFFTPSPPVAQQIEAELRTLGLTPGHYRSVHIRAFYGVDTRDENLIRWWTQNAINCATSILPACALPILFVSDSVVAKEEATIYSTKHNLPVVHRHHNQLNPPLHLEKNNSTNIQDFYDIFVDLLMIGMGQCTAYHMGGFGRWGSMISHNSSCILHMRATMIECELLSPLPDRKQDHFNNYSNNDYTPLFLPPMQQQNTAIYNDSMEYNEGLSPSISIHAQTSIENGFNFSHLSFVLDDRIYKDPFVYEEYDSVKLGVNLWERSKKLPSWMKKYFKWHKKQRRSMLNPENWKSMRLLVMECLQHQPKCGGTSDRLKPLPTLIRIAASTQRFLMIHWTRPCRLEEFLLPPKGGLDWRVPDWLRKCCCRPVARNAVLLGQISHFIDQLWHLWFFQIHT